MKISLQIDRKQFAATQARMETLEASLRDRTGLNRAMAGAGESFLQEYVAGIPDHKTAQGLGATPTNHLANVARRIEGQSDAEAAWILVPRRSRLRAAFGEYTIRPGAGKKYLTIPANAKTYGKRAGEISEPLHFQIVGGRHKALCFEDGTVAYWLRTEVTIPHAPTLIPFEILTEELVDAGSEYLEGTPT